MLNPSSALTARVRNAYSQNIRSSVTLGFVTPNIRIVDIDGLAAIKSTLRFVDSATEAGSRYVSSRDPERNIVLTVEFDPDYTSAENSTVTALRAKLGKVFNPKSRVELLFQNDFLGETMFISGVVESNEPTLFAETTRSTISIICEYPYFESPYQGGYETVNLTTSENSQLVPYDRDVPVGFIYEFDVLANYTGSLGIRQERDGKGLYVQTAHLAGDRIIFSTERDNRYVRRIRNSGEQNVLSYFSGELQDVKLYDDENWFQVSTFGVQTGNHRIRYKRFRGTV